MVVANAWREDIREEMVTGSMGVPLPGWSATVLEDLTDEEAAPGTVGRLAVDRANSPLMWFTGYHQAPEKTAEGSPPTDAGTSPATPPAATRTDGSTSPAATTT
jgi:acetyl-CoA synthetase